VRRNVELPLVLQGWDSAKRKARAMELLEMVQLADFAEHRPWELSGGMQQRVGLARAFATDAPILLMDEPFSALDPLIRTRLQDELIELQSTLRRTIIFVSHDLDEAFKLGDRIAIMEGGRIVQVGTPREIFKAPADDYVADFVAHMNPLGVLTARDVMGPPAGLVLAEVGPHAPVRDVMALLTTEAEAVAVVEDGVAVGRITRDMVLARLLDPRG